MIKLKELLKLDSIKYSCDIKPKHKKKMNMKTELISDDMRIPEKPFPENSSRLTRNELQQLIDYNAGIINEDFIKKGDDVEKVFKDYCKDENISYDAKYFKQILEESSKTILSMKYHYNRPRPKQLADYYGMVEFQDVELSSMKTPSYPSGHSTQGHLVAELLGRQYPQRYEDFKALARMVSASRLMARAHYPSDIKFGEECAQHILGKVIQKKND